MLRFLFILFFTATVMAQEPQDKSGIIDDNNKNSSSFVADPDPLDPLPVKNENIKDGEEIILDDIRQVIDQPAAASPAKETQATPTQATPTRTTPAKRIKSTTKKNTKKSTSSRLKKLRVDDPDERIESRLHREYLNYNINPTSVDQWARATEGQKENIYVVQKNDNLFTISRTLFGDSKFWPKIWALNRSSILNPHQILPGMRISFFSGDGENAPTLSLSANSKIQGETVGDRQETEFGNKLLSSVNKNKNRSYPVPIPDSLPRVRNGRLNAQDTSKIQIDIQDLQYNEMTEYKNPYFLTSKVIKSDFSVPSEQQTALLCRDNQLVPLVVKNNSEVGAGKYLLVVQLVRNSNGLKDTYKYKNVGSVTINNENQMRVTNCKQLLDTDTLIVSEEKMASISEPDEKFDFSPRIVDGFDFQTQNFYADHQYMVINIGNLNVDNGANLNIYSNVLGKNVGRVRILRRSGTTAIGVVTNTYDQITHGDSITE